jgi:hypothetical protein
MSDKAVKLKTQICPLQKVKNLYMKEIYRIRIENLIEINSNWTKKDSQKLDI